MQKTEGAPATIGDTPERDTTEIAPPAQPPALHVFELEALLEEVCHFLGFLQLMRLSTMSKGVWLTSEKRVYNLLSKAENHIRPERVVDSVTRDKESTEVHTDGSALQLYRQLHTITHKKLSIPARMIFRQYFVLGDNTPGSLNLNPDSTDSIMSAFCSPALLDNPLLWWLLTTERQAFWHHLKDTYGNTALHWAAKNGYMSAIDRILTAELIDINAEDHYGQTALHWAAANEHVETVEFLLKKGANTEAAIGPGPVESLTKGKKTKPELLGLKPLGWAVLRKHLEIVKKLITHGADVSGESQRVVFFRPLFEAARGNNDELLHLLCRSGTITDSIVNQTYDHEKKTWSALSVAIQYKKLQNARTLIDAGTHLQLNDFDLLDEPNGEKLFQWWQLLMATPDSKEKREAITCAVFSDPNNRKIKILPTFPSIVFTDEETRTPRLTWQHVAQSIVTLSYKHPGILNNSALKKTPKLLKAVNNTRKHTAINIIRDISRLADERAIQMTATTIAQTYAAALNDEDFFSTVGCFSWRGRNKCGLDFWLDRLYKKRTNQSGASNKTLLTIIGRLVEQGVIQCVFVDKKGEHDLQVDPSFLKDHQPAMPLFLDGDG